MEKRVKTKQGDTPESLSSIHKERPSSPASMKSDWSQDREITFKHGDVTHGSSPLHHEKPPSPVPTCVSMKSDWSQDREITFQQGDITDKLRGQMNTCKPDAISNQNTQGQLGDLNLKHIFQKLEQSIISFVQNELERFKKILSPDYQEEFADKVEEESDAREGVLYMALHFLRSMTHHDIAEKLQANELLVLGQTELKRNLKKKYHSIFEGTPKQGGSALLEKIYTEIYITEGGSGKVNKEHEVRQIESLSKRPAGQDTSIKCRDIFKPLPGQDKPIRSVVTKGVAGIGKTVSVQKFILDWAKGEENQDIHFIFPLTFRELNLLKDNELSLRDLLQHFFTEVKQLRFPSRRKYMVLFIFDGLDECRLKLDFQKNDCLTDVTEVTSLDKLLTNLIKGNLLPSALLWITSRPAAVNQIPPECVDRVTEAQGFSDKQKEEYFKKRIIDQNLANNIISHIKSSRSLHIMCHIPVFCWIAVSVLEIILSFSGSKQIPKTLTEMYTYFLIFQTKQRSLKFEGTHDSDPQWNQEGLLALGKLAYEQLEKGHLIFYEKDLTDSGIDVREAAVQSGICTQIFKEEVGPHQRKVYCFVHLSIQEYLAALYVLLMLTAEHKDVLSKPNPPSPGMHRLKKILSGPPTVGDSMIILQKNAVNKALEYEDGRFDLFLRFLLGLSLESNQNLLHGLLQSGQNEMVNKKTIMYIKEKIREIPTSERIINLFHCLNELNDHSLVEEVQSYMSAGTLSEAKLSPVQLSAVVFVLLTSEENLEVFDLKKYIRSDEGLLRLLPLVEESQKALLNNCRLTERSCRGLGSVLSKSSSKLKDLDLSGNSIGDAGVQELCSGLTNPNYSLETLKLSNCSLTERSCRGLGSVLNKASSKLKDLDLSGNSIGDAGVQELCSGLNNPNCSLETLKLSTCGVTEKGCTGLASALKLNPNHLRELDLRGNDPGTSGIKVLLDLKDDPQCKLKNIRFLKSVAAEEACAAVTSAVGSNPLLMTKLNLKGLIPGQLGVTQLCALLEDPHCRLQTLYLRNCSITEEGFSALASALRSNPSHIRRLWLDDNKAGDSGGKNLAALLEHPNCRIQRLLLRNCSIAEEGFSALVSALRSNPSHIRRLWLNNNKAGDSGGTNLAALLEDPNCRIQQLLLCNCSITEEGYSALVSALRSNPSHIRDLWLSDNKAGDSGGKHLAALLEDPNCKLEELNLHSCSITEEGFRSLASALRSNPSHIRDLKLGGNEKGDSRVKYLSAFLQDSNCKLEKLNLMYCSITEEGFRSLSAALRSNPSHLRELSLEGNKVGDAGMKNICSLLVDPNCKLETLRLSNCNITEEGFRCLAAALRSKPSTMRELHLGDNKPGPSTLQLFSELKNDPKCKHIQIYKLS